jgi:hypothetical protein
MGLSTYERRVPAFQMPEIGSNVVTIWSLAMSRGNRFCALHAVIPDDETTSPLRLA